MMRQEKNKGKKKFWKIWLFLFMICPLALGQMMEEVRAKETEGKSEAEIIETIEKYRNGIVHIEAKCWDGKETVYENRTFSGFAVSQDSGGIYIVTVCNGLTYTAEEKQEIEQKYKTEENSNVNVVEQIEVVFNGDLKVQASIVGESRQRNLTILRLDQNVNFENVLSFADDSILSGSRGFLLSYPKMKNEKKAVYNIDNVKITEGTIMDAYQKNEITFFRHNIKADEASLGGPILNEDGAIAGLFLKAKGKNAGTALAGKEIQAFLDTFNISYAKYQKEVPAKKFSIYHKILGCVILLLLIAVIQQRRKGAVNPEEKAKGRKKDRYSAKTVKEESLAGGKKKNGKEIKVSAKLEYPAEKRVITMHKAMFVIGRAKEADFILSESQGISRKHACIQFDGKYFYLSDLSSTNHTFLNGFELGSGEKRVLKDGDEIRVARERLIFRVEK